MSEGLSRAGSRAQQALGLAPHEDPRIAGPRLDLVVLVRPLRHGPRARAAGFSAPESREHRHGEDADCEQRAHLIDEPRLNHRAGSLADAAMKLVARPGHDKREISLLKMDCEGCEWSVFSHYRAFVSSGSMRPIRQLSFEVHFWSFAAGMQNLLLQQFFDMFEWFYKSNYRVISWEPNGWGCTEYTLLLDERCSDACLL